MKIPKHYPYKSSYEQRYARWLEEHRLAGEIKSWRYEPEVFVLARRETYTPDFEVVTLEGDRHFFEVKGYHKNLYVSRNKWKCAGEKFRSYRWFWVTWNAQKGAWKHEEYKPLTGKDTHGS